MPKPVLLSVDDDSDVLRAIERDLRSQYGAEYRVMGSDSPESALDILKQLKVATKRLGCFLVDSGWRGRMEGNFFRGPRRYFPIRSAACSTPNPAQNPRLAQ